MKRIKGDLLICNGRPDLHSHIQNIDLVNFKEGESIPVNVNFDDDRRVGIAYLSKEGNRVVATIQLNDNFDPLYTTLIPCAAGQFVKNILFIE